MSQIIYFYVLPIFLTDGKHFESKDWILRLWYIPAQRVWDNVQFPFVQQLQHSRNAPCCGSIEEILKDLLFKEYAI